MIQSYRRPKNRGRLNARLKKMPEFATTSEVRDTLQVCESTIRKWRAKPEFVQLDIVREDQKGLIWDTEKLRLWLIVIGAIKQTPKRFAQNPPLVESIEEAAEKLGMELKEE